MSPSPLQLVFAGTPDFAARHLQAIVHSSHRVVGVFTQPDRPAGRGKKLTPSPVKALAQHAGLPVFQPATLKTPEAQAQLATLQPDVMVVVAYGLILPQAILDTPRLGCLNVHASLLPRWRGAAPIQRAIEAGDSETGTTIMQMDAGLDTLAERGAALLLEVLDDLPRYQAEAVAQPEEGVTYAAKIAKTEAALDWRLDARLLQCRIRAFNPFPVCFSVLQGERVKIWDAALSEEDGTLAPGTIVAADRGGIRVQCGRGQLRITRLQLPGARALAADQVLNARAELFAAGAQFAPAPAWRSRVCGQRYARARPRCPGTGERTRRAIPQQRPAWATGPG